MSTRYVIAIVPTELLETLERKLSSVHAPGLTVTKVKGYGEYKNFLASDLTTVHTKIEIFVDESILERIVGAIVEVAHSSVPGAGIVGVLPVEQFLHLHTPDGTPAS